MNDNNNCSMDARGGGHILQEELLSQVTREMKPEQQPLPRQQRGNLELEPGSLISPWEPAAPVGQVCKPAECEPALPSFSQELTEEFRVWRASLSGSGSLATTVHDLATQPLPLLLPRANLEITDAKCSGSVGAESTNSVQHESPDFGSPELTTCRTADTIQTQSLANTHQLPADTETRSLITTTTTVTTTTATTEATTVAAHHAKEEAEARAPSANNTHLSTSLIRRESNSHADCAHSPSSVQLITADTGTQAAEVHSVTEPREDTSTVTLAGTSPTTPGDAGHPKLSR